MGRILFSILLSSLLLISFFGCSSMGTSKDQYAGVMEKLRQQDYDSCIEQIEGSKDTSYKEKEKVLFYLDLGMLYHYNGEYEKSNQFLTEAEYAIEDLYTKSIGKAAASLLLNDNALDYFGEDYEDIYLNVFKTLNYLHLNKFEDAFVEIRRVNNKLNLLEDKYEEIAKQYNKSENRKKKFKIGDNKFHNSALARYLSMLLYQAKRKYDDARIDMAEIEEAFELQPAVYDFTQPDLDKYLSPSDNAQLYFLTFVGNSPEKKANTLWIHTEENKLIIASASELPDGGYQKLEFFDVIEWDDVEPGYHFKFPLPYMEKLGTDIGRIEVIIDEKPAFEMYPLESIENAAFATYKIKEPLIYLKTITRTVAKGLISEQGKQEMVNQVGDNIFGKLARIATDVAVDATENADLRISRFFPATAYIGNVTVEPGIHSIRINYFNKQNSLVYSDFIEQKNIRKDGLNLIESYYLD